LRFGVRTCGADPEGALIAVHPLLST
jgi:hypothetical protein